MPRFYSAVTACLLFFTAIASASTLTASSSVDDVLDAMDQQGKNLKSLTADISTADSDPTLGTNPKVNVGKLFYQNLGDGDARFRATFSKPQKHDYLFADGNLVDRDYDRHTQNTSQMLKPGEKMQLFKLDGPFPLPLGQDKQDVHKAFEVTKAPPAGDDPAGTIHLKLLPHAGTELARKFESIDLWLDPKTNFPVRITTLDVNESTQKQTDLSNLKINGPVTESDFQMEPVDFSKGWNVKGE